MKIFFYKKSDTMFLNMLSSSRFLLTTLLYALYPSSIEALFLVTSYLKILAECVRWSYNTAMTHEIFDANICN